MVAILASSSCFAHVRVKQPEARRSVNGVPIPELEGAQLLHC
jgi:hypothetical protein